MIYVNVNKLESHSQNGKRKKHNIKIQLQSHRGFPSGSAVKNLLANAGEVQGMCVGSLGQEDPLEEGMATHSSILAWRIPWKEKPGRLQSVGRKESGYNWAAKHARSLVLTGWPRCRTLAAASNGERVERQKRSSKCRMIQTLWKTIWWFLTKLNIFSLSNTATALLGIYPKKLKIYVRTEISTQQLLQQLSS